MNNKICRKIIIFGVLFSLCLSCMVCKASSFSEDFTSFDENVTDSLQYTDDLSLKADGGAWGYAEKAYGVALKASGNSPQLEFPKGGSYTAPFGISFSACFEDVSSSLNIRANYNGSSSGWHSDLRDLIVFNNGTITGKFTSSSTVSYVANTWYQVALLFDFESSTYDVYIDGNKISTTSGSIGSRTAIKYFRFIVNGESGAGDGNVYIDNLIACDKSIAFTSTVADGSEIEITKGDITLDFGTYVKCTSDSDISITCDGNTASGVTLKPEKIGDYFKKLVIDVDGRYSPSSSYTVSIGSGVKTFWGISAEREFEFSTMAYVPSVSISLPDDLSGIVGGEQVRVGISPLNLESDDKIVIYNNNKAVATLASGATSYDLVALAGNNKVKAKVESVSGNVKVESSELSFTAGGTIAGRVVYFVDFETDDGSAWVGVDNSNGGMKSVENDSVDSSRGKVLKVSGNNVIENGRTFLPNMNSDIVVYEDMRRYASDVGNEYFTVMAGINATGGTAWINPWRLKHGEIVTDGGGAHIADFDETQWHKVRVEYNLKDSKASLYIDDVLVDKNRSIATVSYYQRVKYETRNRTIFYDNMTVYFAGNAPSGTVEVYNGSEVADEESVNYSNASFKVNFTERMDSTSLTSDAVKLTSEYGENVPVEIAFSDVRTMTVTPKSSLMANTEYTLSVSGENVKSGAGIQMETPITKTVKTSKLPFSIKTVAIQGGSISNLTPNSNFTVSVSVNDIGATGAKAGAFVGLYKNKECASIAYIPIDASVKTSRYELTLKAPSDIRTGGYELKTFMVDGLQNLNLIDFE